MRPEVDKIYKRYDGKYFIVLEIAKTEDERMEFVIYRSLSDEFSDKCLALPLVRWFETVEYDGESHQYFTEIDPTVEFDFTKTK